MQELKILRKDPLAITLWNAMCNQPSEVDISKKFTLVPEGEESTVTVEVLVNGVSVDLVSELRSFVEHVASQLDELVKDKALELIRQDEVLDGIRSDLEMLDWKMRERIEQLSKA